ncbi:cation:proton antiporter [Amnibacterium flavum]|uniref:Na+/H+ antiporter n=1 Tax=Amnibacterium flavum TaxID=2173173 RepID=A0A2V1HQ18_9MICO|nr:cation:proton antiporter [Amnibacterium flavum]PVZ94628.1 Na+/H+ antiporter [Amnibacterium flavum]
MDSVETIIGVVLFVIVTVSVTGFTGKFGWSAPVALVVIGAIASFIPAVPTVEVEPDVILYAVLPPLLFAAAIHTSLIDIRARLDSILLLSVGLVVFTVFTVGLTTWLVVPGITLAAGLAFGAVVAPTDTVAVNAVVGRLRLPRRLLTVLEGESLLNDAVALVALNASILAITSVVTPAMIGVDLLLAVGVGLAVGIGVGFLFAFIRSRLRAPVLDTSLSLITPYVTFIPAQLLHGSGVLAVVVAGLFLAYRSPTIQSASARIAESINWRTIGFLLENAVFLIIGLSLADIVEAASEDFPDLWTTVMIIAAVLGAVFLARAVWVTLSFVAYTYGPGFLRDRRWGWRNSVAVGVAGVRGVVTLVAVLLLPPETPHRAFLQLLAVIVIIGSLLAGLLLPTVIRKLRLPPPNAAQERTQRQLLMAEAQAAGLKLLDDLDLSGIDQRVVRQLRDNASFLADVGDLDAESDEPQLMAYAHLRKTMIRGERDAVIAARQEGRFEEYAVQDVLSAIDAEEIALKTSAGGTIKGEVPRKPGMPPTFAVRGDAEAEGHPAGDPAGARSE